MTSKENNYSFSHAPCLSPFKLSLSDHLLTWNGINAVMNMTKPLDDSPAHFKIRISERLIVVRTKGTWTLQTDMAYLSELGEAMHSMRGNTWAVLVDMRGWVVPETVSSSPFKLKAQLDRRNQKLECWIVDDMEQGNALLPYFQASGIVPKRFLDPTEAIAYLHHAKFVNDKVSFEQLNGLLERD